MEAGIKILDALDRSSIQRTEENLSHRAKETLYLSAYMESFSY